MRLGSKSTQRDRNLSCGGNIGRGRWGCMVLAWLVGSIVLACATAASGAVAYAVQDLGHFHPTGINDQGQVVGFGGTPPGDSYLYDGSKLIDLTKAYGLGGPSSGGPWALNNRGQIAGAYAINATPGNTGVEHAFLFENGKMTDLGTLGGYSMALKLNDSGLAVGVSNLTSVETDPYYPVQFTGGKVIRLTASSGTAAAVNNTGQVVGDYMVGNDSHAFTYANGALSDLGTLGGPNSDASAINDLGQVVGSSEIASGTRDAFLYQNGKMIDLGHVIKNGAAFPTYAYGINNSGTIVGESIYFSLGSPFVYQNGRFEDLSSLVDPKLDINFEWIAGINDRGQLAVLGNSPATPSEEAYLLTPLPEPTPAPLILLAAGFLARRRQILCSEGGHAAHDVDDNQGGTSERITQAARFEPA